MSEGYDEPMVPDTDKGYSTEELGRLPAAEPAPSNVLSGELLSVEQVEALLLTDMPEGFDEPEGYHVPAKSLCRALNSLLRPLIAQRVQEAVGGAYLAAQAVCKPTDEGDDCNAGCHDADRVGIGELTTKEALAALERRDERVRAEGFKDGFESRNRTPPGWDLNSARQIAAEILGGWKSEREMEFAGDLVANYAHRCMERVRAEARLEALRGARARYLGMAEPDDPGELLSEWFENHIAAAIRALAQKGTKSDG